MTAPSPTPDPTPVSAVGAASDAPRPAVLSRLLGKAGFDRAESESTSIRGHHRYSPGYRVIGAKAAWEDGYTQDPTEPAVYVECQTLNTANFDDRRTSQEIAAELLPGYEQVLRDAGYTVERVERHGPDRILRVTRGATR